MLSTGNFEVNSKDENVCICTFVLCFVERCIFYFVNKLVPQRNYSHLVLNVSRVKSLTLSFNNSESWT